MAALSGGSLITAGPAGEILGVSRWTVANLGGNGSGFFDVHGPQGLRSGQAGTDRGWGRDRAEDLVFFREYCGGPGQGRPWGIKRDWDHHAPEQFRRWMATMQEDGWEASYLGEGGWRLVLRAGCASEPPTMEIWPG